MEKRGKFNITYLRRALQILFFILIVYGAFIFGKFVMTYDIGAPTLRQYAEVNESISQTYRYIADYHLPVRSCSKVSDSNRYFQGCMMRFLSERLTMGSLFLFLPQILFILVILVIFGRFLCGWVCPVGFTSDVFAWFRKKLKVNPVKVPERAKDFMNQFKYYLLAIVIITSFAVTLPFLGGSVIRKEFYQLSCQFCPSKVLFGLLPGGWNLYLDFTTPLFTFFTVISIIFSLMIALSFFIDRFWCRICPNGALISLFNKVSLFKKEKDVRKCTKCGICMRVCPTGNMNTFEEKKKKNINTEDCIMCLECVNKCPEKDCLKLKFLGKDVFKSKLNPK